MGTRTCTCGVIGVALYLTCAIHAQDSVPDHCLLKKPTSKRPFLKRGEGIARFCLKSARVKFRNKSQQQKMSQQHKVERKAQRVDQLTREHTQRKCLRSMSSPLLSSTQGVVSCAGILAGRDGCEVRGGIFFLGFGSMRLFPLFCSLILAPPCL